MKIRTQNENYSFIENLESAIGKTQEAISNISYSSYPNVNKETIIKLETAISIMEDMLEMDIFKP